MPSGLHSHVFDDFSGGWNTRDGPFQLRDNESPDMRNVTLLTRGALDKRGGRTRFDTSGFPATKRASHLRAWYPGSSKFLMASIDGDIYSSDTAGALTSRVDGTAGTTWMMEDMQDVNGTQFLWACNGTDAPRRISTAFTVTNWTALVDTDTDYHIIRVWRNRMIAVKKNTNRLYMSAIGNPESFGANDFLDVKASDDDNDWITWMEVVGDNLIVFKKQSVWSLYAEPPAPAVRQLGGPGAEDRFQSCVVEGRVYYWNRTGLWSTDGESEPVFEHGPVENFIRERMNHARHSQARVFPGRDRRVFVSIPLDSVTENNFVMELVPYMNSGDRDGGPWIPHDMAVASACTFRPSDVDKLFAGTSTDVGICSLFDGADDQGTPIESYWQSSWKSIVEVEKYERLRRINVLMEGQATIKVFKDFQETSSYADILEAGTASDPLWDGGTWDGGLWNEATGADLLHTRPESRARYHAVRLENSDATAPMTVFAVELMARGGKEH